MIFLFFVVENLSFGRRVYLMFNYRARPIRLVVVLVRDSETYGKSTVEKSIFVRAIPVKYKMNVFSIDL